MAKKRHSLQSLSKKLPKNYKKILLPLFLFLFLTWLYFFDFKNSTFHIDEHEFTRKTFYFELFFLKRNLKDPRWYTQDSFIQPKLGPYIYGLTLRLSGIQEIEQTLKDINFRNINVGDTSWWWTWWAKPLKDPPADLVPSFKLIWQGRKVSILFSLTALILVFLLCSKIKGLPFGLISTFFLGINPLFFAFGRKAMTDSMQLLAFILNLLLFMLLTKTLDKNDKKKTILLSLAMGVNAAFGVGVKVSGILTLLFLAIMFPILLILQRLHKRPHRLLILSYSIIGISFFTIFVSLHPYLYHDPLRRFFSMFTDRLAEDVVNRTLLPLHAVHGGNAALKLILIRTLISDEITNFNFYGIPVDLFLLPVGLFVLAKKALKTLFDKRTISGELILVAWFLVAFISLTFYLRLDLPRYYIPTLASITIIQSYALIYLLHDLWFVSRKKTRQKLGRPKTPKTTRRRRS
jgi:hypothetical protein